VADTGDDDDKAIAASWHADAFEVGYNGLQFRMDCGHDQGSDSEVVKVYLRIITSPIDARELFRLLGAGLLRYADTFGPINHARPPRTGPRP
jgi:hypothetical protein